MDAAASSWGRRTFASFAEPRFRRFYIALMVSMLGFWMRIAALGWLVYELTGSHERLGLITAASLLPWILVSPLAGAWADRRDGRWLIAGLHIAAGSANLVLGIGLLAGVVVWEHLLAFAILTGCLRGMENPVRHAFLRELVGVKGVANAIGLSAAGFHMMAAVGPSLVGLIYEVGGAGPCFLVVAATTVPMAVLVPRLPVEVRPNATGSGHVVHQLAQGFRYVWTHDLTRMLVFGAGLTMLLLWSFRTLLPAISKDSLALGPSGYGLVMGVLGVGSFLGALWVAGGAATRVAPGRRLLVLVWIGAGAIAWIGWSFTAWIAAPALLVAGFCNVGFMAASNATIQQHVPDALRARVMGIWALMFGAAFPLGGMLMGWLADWRDTQFAVSAGVAAALLCSLLLLVEVRRRRPASAVALDDELRQGPQQAG